jgi:hypothetical protein
LDYWLKSHDMLAHDDAVMRYCEVLGQAGYHIFVKDHPLQFGFRQREIFERLARLNYVTLVPYEVSAGEMIEKCGVSLTFTGTIGFQAALAGLCSVATDPYYVTEQHFLLIRNVVEIPDLVGCLQQWRPPSDIHAARRAMVRHLSSISLPGDYFTWRRFNASNKADRESVVTLVDSLNSHLPAFVKSGKISSTAR